MNIMTPAQTPFWRVPNRVAYIVSHSYPHSTNGYAVRTHGIARALVKQGHSVVVITRPGRPWDLEGGASLEVPPMLNIDGVRYRYIQTPSTRGKEPEIWRQEAAKALASELKLFKPSIVLAASNWETALPAMKAAQRLEIPFYYEVRGFWEITRASKEPGWDQTTAFRDSVDHETRIAQAAERVFTLNEQMRTELIARGLDKRRIDLVPNAWAAPSDGHVLTQSQPSRLNKATRYMVGYIGSFVSYEGLDDLVVACADLRFSGIDLSLCLVGSSSPTSGNAENGKPCEITQELTELAKEHDFLPFLQIHGRTSPSNLSDYYHILDLVALPRKPLPVTHLVSPIKPLEAAAYGKALLVSDVGGLKDVVEELGLPVFRSGDRQALAQQIKAILLDEARRNAMGNQARQWVATKRQFSTVITPMLDTFKTIGHVGQKLQLASGHNNPAGSDENSPINQHIVAISQQGGADALAYYLKHETHSKPKSNKESFKYLQTARHLLDQGDTGSAILLTDNVLESDSSLSALRIAMRIYMDSTEFFKAKALADQFKSKAKKLSASEDKLLKEIAGRLQLANLAAQPAATKKFPSQKGRVLNLLAFSLPYTSVGYATRSHGLAIGIKNAGWDIRPYTRPGFPFDFKPELEGKVLPEQDKIDGIVYRRIFDVGRKGISEADYMLTAVKLYEQIIQKEQPEVVHAASNYVTALPALIAARRMGVPFVYEVRGFWEVTRSSRDNNFIYTPKYRFMEFYEGITARNADRVITITTAMKEELIARGVPEERIAIAFNSVDPDRFLPHPPNKALAATLGIPDDVPVIGYVGSFVDYEGLDDLITACSGIKSEGIDFRLLLVGDGAVFEDLKNQVAEIGISDKTIMAGRVPHEMVEEYYSLIDIAPFPRKPWEVCELVSPLKPYEAMALEKAVVVSSTRALTEIVSHESTGFVFAKGDVADLQKKITKLLQENLLKVSLGRKAREWIKQERSWDVAGSCCVQSYIACTEEAGYTQSNAISTGD